MSSRPLEHRRRDRSWEREDRDRYSRSGRSGTSRNTYDESRRRSSRSRSPRRGDRDRRPSDRRERDDDRRDRDRDWDRNRERDRRDERRRRDDDRDRDRDRRDDKRDLSRKERNQDSSHRPRDEDVRSSQTLKTAVPTNVPDLTDTASKPVISRPNLDPDAPDEEEGEAMDAENEDDAAMMALMGMSGFGSTKGKAVEGNQEGGVFLKKQRTWRQYMNRRGGFNRPLDKIK